MKWRTGSHEWRNTYDVWQLHYLPVDDGNALRTADRYEAEMLNAIASLQAQLDALS